MVAARDFARRRMGTGLGRKRRGSTSEWRKVRVPGSVHLQWLPQGGHLQARGGLGQLQGVVVQADPARAADWGGQTLRLQFGATDYFAETFIDGQRLGRHEGYVTPHEYDVTALVKPGHDHELKVRVWTPVHYYWKHRPYTVKGAYGGVDQKPDDITAVGITRSVRITAGAPVKIADLAVDTRLNADGTAPVAVDVEAAGVPGEYEWEVTLAPRNFEGGGAVQLKAPVEEERARLLVPVSQPRLWWTWDHGKPNLYTLDVRLKNAAGDVLDARRMAVGLRTITRIGDRFYLNGKFVFLRGTNVYANLWLSEMGRKEYERDFEILQKMNVNLLRVHCHFENPEFYELADERGLFVWQDYLEAWYPARSRIFAARRGAVRRSHPDGAQPPVGDGVVRFGRRGFRELSRPGEARGRSSGAAGPAGPLRAALHQPLGRHAPLLRLVRGLHLGVRQNDRAAGDRARRHRPAREGKPRPLHEGPLAGYGACGTVALSPAPDSRGHVGLGRPVRQADARAVDRQKPAVSPRGSFRSPWKGRGGINQLVRRAFFTFSPLISGRR
jgi:hypothetical protein